MQTHCWARGPRDDQDQSCSQESQQKGTETRKQTFMGQCDQSAMGQLRGHNNAEKVQGPDRGRGWWGGGFPEKVTALMRLKSEQESTRQGPAGVRRAFQGQHVAVGERALLRVELWGESLWPRRGALRRS